MSEPFLAEIKIVGFNFAPRSFAACDGQILPINQNQSLYSLLGTTYGGDGRTTFALPDMRGRTPVHVGDGFTQGAKSGEEAHVLSLQEMPAHSHELNALDYAGGVVAGSDASDAYFSQTESGRRPLVPYGPAANTVELHPSTISNTAGDQGHENMQPFITINFVIALQGLFPSRN